MLFTFKQNKRNGHRTLWKATLINAAFQVRSKGAVELWYTDSNGSTPFCLFAVHPKEPEAVDTAACQQNLFRHSVILYCSEALQPIFQELYLQSSCRQRDLDVQQKVQVIHCVYSRHTHCRNHTESFFN